MINVLLISIFYLIYILFNPIIYIIVSILKLFNNKLYDRSKNYNKVLNQLKLKLKSNNKKILLFHSASNGEFAALKPILQKIDRDKYFVIQSFLSPSGYDRENNEDLYDFKCYHPYDVLYESLYFFYYIRPEKYIIPVNDVWPLHTLICKYFNVKMYYLNVAHHEDSIWKVSIFKSLYIFIFSCFNLLTVTTKELFNDLKNYVNPNKILIIQDTRYDNIVNRYQLNINKNILPKSLLDSFNIILYYEHNEELDLFVKSIEEFYTDTKLKELNQRLIIVPHDTDTKTLNHLETHINKLNIKCGMFSKKEFNHRIIIIDAFGILCEIYKYGHLVYIGGGTKRDGVHSVSEPAIYKCLIGHGSYYNRLPDAVYFQENKLSVIINDKNDMIKFFELYKNKEKIMKIGNQVHNYILNQAGSSEKIKKILEY